MFQIFDNGYQFVPGSKRDHQLKTIWIGDLKSMERALNVQLEQRDGNTSAKRFEGFIPSLADFHTYGNYLGVILVHYS